MECTFYCWISKYNVGSSDNTPVQHILIPRQIKWHITLITPIYCFLDLKEFCSLKKETLKIFKIWINFWIHLNFHACYQQTLKTTILSTNTISNQFWKSIIYFLFTDLLYLNFIDSRRENLGRFKFNSNFEYVWSFYFKTIEL